MKKRNVMYALCCLSGWATAASLPDEYVSSNLGQVQIHGSLVSTACTLRMDTVEQAVSLEAVSAKDLPQRGARSVGVPFRLTFRDCLLGAYDRLPAGRHSEQLLAKAEGINTDLFLLEATGAVLTFVGDADVADLTLLKVSGDARGVGVRLSDAKGKALNLNQANAAYMLNPGDNMLTFYAALEATERGVLAGDFNAVVNVRVSYL